METKAQQKALEKLLAYRELEMAIDKAQLKDLAFVNWVKNG